jgi:hypothetical protein
MFTFSYFVKNKNNDNNKTGEVRPGTNSVSLAVFILPDEMIP